MAVLVRGSVAAFSITVFARFISFPVSIVLARAMGPDNFGIYTYVNNWVAITGLFAVIGLPTAIVRFAAAYRATEEWGLLRGLLRRARLILFLTSTTSSIVVIGVLLLLRDRIGDPVFLTFVIALAAAPFRAQRGVQHSALRALGKFAWSQLLSTISQPMMVGAMAAMVLLLWTNGQLDAPTVMLMEVLAGLVILAVGAFLVGRALPQPVRTAEPRHSTREWIRVSLPLLLVSGARITMLRTDILMVGVLIGTTQAGFYAIAVQLARVASWGLTSTTYVASPMVAGQHARDAQDEVQRTFSLSTWGSTLAALGAGIGVIVFRDHLLGLYGSEFQAAAIVLIILVVARMLDALTGPIGSLLNMTGHQDRNAVILWTTSALSVVFAFPFIQLWGIEGAAVLTGLVMAIKNLWTWFEVRRRLGINASIFAPLPFK